MIDLWLKSFIPIVCCLLLQSTSRNILESEKENYYFNSDTFLRLGNIKSGDELAFCHEILNIAKRRVVCAKCK